VDARLQFRCRAPIEVNSQKGNAALPREQLQELAPSPTVLPFNVRNDDAAGNEGLRRQRLRDFLITHRAAISPESAGLPRVGRRRTPGLRREEVATLAGVGVTWYTWLEQGRDIQASGDTLQRIANVLRLTVAEKCHLFDLAALPHHGATLSAQILDKVMQSILDGFRDGPAFVLGPLADVEGYNTIADAIYQFAAVSGPFARNQIWRFFMDPSRRRLFSNWDACAPLCAGQLRFISGTYLGNPYLEQMIQDMLDGSERFRSLWSAQHAINTSTAPIHFHVPDIGDMTFVSVRFRPVSAMDWVLCLLSPVDDQTRARVGILG
jgi:transcriptional regulator with XRE-family HTH domain